MYNIKMFPAKSKKIKNFSFKHSKSTLFIEFFIRFRWDLVLCVRIVLPMFRLGLRLHPFNKWCTPPDDISAKIYIYLTREKHADKTTSI